MDENKVINALIEHGERLDKIEEIMATKTDVNLILNKLDMVLSEVKTSRQEAVVANHRLDKVEAKVGV